MNFENELFIILIATSPIFVLVGLLLVKFPPKSINSSLGYRTKQSKSSPEKWAFSQLYAGVQIIKSGVMGCLIAVGCLFISSEGFRDVIIGLIAVFVLSLYPIYKTEKAMRQKFDSN